MNLSAAARPEAGDSGFGATILSADALARLLEKGSPALLPTDTVPALAASPPAATQIWRRKRRSLRKPLILMGADGDQIIEVLAVPWRPEWIEKVRSCWPGAVTLVLPIRNALTDSLHPGGASLGVRVPACGMTQALLRLTGPLATTSANLSGHPPATTAEEAIRSFPDLPLLGPLPWPSCSGRASEVLEWDCRLQDWRILRQGAPSAGVSPPT